MSFYWKNICKQKTAPESEKVDPALFLFPFKVQVCMLYLPSWQSFHYFLDFITEQFIQHLSILQIVMHSFDFAKSLKFS